MRQVNVTVTLPAELVREARHLAVDRGVSLSKYLSTLLQEQVESVRNYASARERQRRLMERGLGFTTHGKIGWSRDDLHER